MSHSLTQKRREALRRRLSSLSVQFCNDPCLLANPILAKNTFYADLLASLDWADAEIAVTRSTKAKQLARYAVRSSAWLGSLAVNSVITRLCWASPLQAEFAVSGNAGKQKAAAGGESARPLILIDTFFHMRRIAEKGTFAEVYMPRMAEALAQAGVDYAYLPRICEGENPLVFYRALKVLERQRVPVVLDTQLLGIRDFAAIAWSIIKTPFAMRQVFKELQRGTTSTSESAAADDHKASEHLAQLSTASLHDKAPCSADSMHSSAAAASGYAVQSGTSSAEHTQGDTPAPKPCCTSADEHCQSEHRQAESSMYDNSAYVQYDAKESAHSDEYFSVNTAFNTAAETTEQIHGQPCDITRSQGALLAEPNLAGTTRTDTPQKGQHAAKPCSACEATPAASFDADGVGPCNTASQAASSDTLSQPEQSAAATGPFIDSRISRALWLSLHDVTARYFTRWRTGRKLGTLLDSLAKVQSNRNLTVVSWFENQQTEKLLFRGIRESGSPSHIIGAQLLVVPPEQMNMQPDMAEEPLDVLPDSILALGPHSLAADTTGRAIAGPALRYGHLFEHDEHQHDSGSDVLILLSISEAENRSLLSRLCEITLPLPDNAALLVKFHPDTNPQEYTALLPRGARPVYCTMPQALQRAQFVIGTGSGSLAEAACKGIPVIVSSMGGSGALNYMPAPGQNTIWFDAHCAADILRHAVRLLSLTKEEQSAMHRNGTAMRNAVFHNPTAERILSSLGVMQHGCSSAPTADYTAADGINTVCTSPADCSATSSANRNETPSRAGKPAAEAENYGNSLSEHVATTKKTVIQAECKPAQSCYPSNAAEQVYDNEAAHAHTSNAAAAYNAHHADSPDKQPAQCREKAASEPAQNEQLTNNTAKEKQAYMLSGSNSCHITSAKAPDQTSNSDETGNPYQPNKHKQAEHPLYRAASASLPPESCYAQALATLPVPAYPAEARRLVPSRLTKAAKAIRRMLRQLCSSTSYGFLTGGLAAPATTTPSPASIADPQKAVAEYEEAFANLLERSGQRKGGAATQHAAHLTESAGVSDRPRTVAGIDTVPNDEPERTSCCDTGSAAAEPQSHAANGLHISDRGHAVSFASGRMGFYALLRAAGIGSGDEVILPAFTCAVMADAILRTGALPVYTDVDPVTLGTSPEAVRQAITPRTKAVVAQHSFGIMCRVDALAEITRKHSLLLIEDCALTLGSRLHDRVAGTYGDAAIFSTDHSKPLNTLIGGVVYTRDSVLYDAVAAIAASAPDLDSDHQLRLWQQLLFESTLHRPEQYGRYPVSSLLRRISDRIYRKGPVLLTADAPEFEAAERKSSATSSGMSGRSDFSNHGSAAQASGSTPATASATHTKDYQHHSHSRTNACSKPSAGDNAMPSGCNHPYPYPARMPAFLAHGGATALVSFDAAAQNRRTMLQRYLDAIAGTPLAAFVPAAYYHADRYIIPHRFVMPVPDAEAMLKRMECKIDTSWIWFREPVVCTATGVLSAGYVRGSCPVSEAMCTHLVNWPTDVPPEHADELLHFFRSVIDEFSG